MYRRLFQLSLICLLPVLLIAQQTPEATPVTANPASPPTTAPTAAQPLSPSPQMGSTLLDGTPVRMRISETVSSADAKVGQEIPFEVVEEVDVNGVPVIAKGATAIATVTAAQPKRRMGRAGKLDISIGYVRLIDQEKAALRGVKNAQGGGHVGAMTGAIVATSIVFFPAAPLFLLIHGKDITIPQGTEITAFVQGDMHLDMAKFVVPRPDNARDTASAPAVATTAPTSILLESTPPGADIAIDGKFVGNTPSTVEVAAGSHQVTVSKKGFSDWTRTISVTGGSIHVDATLDAVGN
ncbi:MAG: PEGA domain-containing protein [Acidobacteriaceae bacterium]